MSAIPYDYEAKGRADYLAGRRDDKLYGDTLSAHAKLYRNGWQQARRMDETTSVASPEEPPLAARVPAVHAEPQAGGGKARGDERNTAEATPRATNKPKPEQLALF